LRISVYNDYPAIKLICLVEPTDENMVSVQLCRTKSLKLYFIVELAGLGYLGLRYFRISLFLSAEKVPCRHSLSDFSSELFLGV